MFSRCALLITIFLCLTVRADAAHGAESDAFVPLYSLLNERLGYMEDVARYKTQNQIPVEDREREAIVLEDAYQLAATAGIDAATMEEFFAAQIAAAKAIQYRFRADMLTRSMPERTIDLEREIRPALDRLGTDIVRMFAEILRAGLVMQEEGRDLFSSTLTASLLTDADKDALFNAMLRVRLLR